MSEAGPVLDVASYSRWLRAQRPPFVWFLERSESEQESLAIIGDDYTREVSSGIGYAVDDPELFGAVDDAAEDPDCEEVLVQRLADAAKARMMGIPEPVPMVPMEPAPTMGGMTHRRESREREVQRSKDSTRRLFGRAPDEVAP